MVEYKRVTFALDIASPPSLSSSSQRAVYSLVEGTLPFTYRPLSTARLFNLHRKHAPRGPRLSVTQLVNNKTRQEWRRRRQAGTADRVHRSTTTSAKPEGQPLSPSCRRQDGSPADPYLHTGPPTSPRQRASRATRQGTNDQRHSSIRKSIPAVTTTTINSTLNRAPLVGVQTNGATPPKTTKTMRTLVIRSGNRTSRPPPTRSSSSSSSRARASDNRTAGRPSLPSAHEAQRDPTSTCSETTVAGEFSTWAGLSAGRQD